MSRRALTSYLAAVALTFGTAPLFAQENPKQEGQRPNSTGSSQGRAESRPAGGGGSGDAGSSAGSSRGSAGSSGESSPAARPRSLPGGGDFSTDVAPQRPERRAVPRDSNASGGDQRRASGDEQRRVSPGTASAPSSDRSGDRRAVPAYGRPRDASRPTIGTAVERRGHPPVIGSRIGGTYYYDPYDRFNNYYSRNPYGYYYAGYGFGMGYFHDPMMWGYYSPYGYAGGYDPYYGGGGGYGQYSRDRYRDVGGLRLKVKPADGQVYVDGYYVGEVDDFDGIFQKLPIEAGAHRIEIRAPGYETVQFEVMVIAGETVTYKGDMRRMQ